MTLLEAIAKLKEAREAIDGSLSMMQALVGTANGTTHPRQAEVDEMVKRVVREGKRHKEGRDKQKQRDYNREYRLRKKREIEEKKKRQAAQLVKARAARAAKREEAHFQKTEEPVSTAALEAAIEKAGFVKKTTAQLREEAAEAWTAKQERKAPVTNLDVPPFRHLVTEVLKEAKKPVYVDELENLLRARGWTTSSENVRGLFSVQMVGIPKIKKVDKLTWQYKG